MSNEILLRSPRFNNVVFTPKKKKVVKGEGILVFHSIRIHVYTHLYVKEDNRKGNKIRIKIKMEKNNY